MFDFSELASFLNDMVSQPGFIYGVAFFFVCEFWCYVFHLPFALLDLLRQRERQHECLLRCEGHIDSPCHYKACPSHGTCPHYKPRERWRFLPVIRQRK